MTGISAASKTAPPSINLLANGNTAGTGINLGWEITTDEEYWGTEVWVSESNDRSLAVLVGMIAGTSHFYIGDAGTEYFFWIRSTNIYEDSTGDWFPVSSTAGVPATVAMVGSTDIAINAVSLSEFGATNATVTGAGGPNYVSVVTFSVTNSSTELLPFSFNHFCLQNYSAGAKQTKWIIRDATLDATIFDWGTIDEIERLPSLATAHAIPANTSRTIVLYWWGEDNTVSITNRAFNFLGLIR